MVLLACLLANGRPATAAPPAEDITDASVADAGRSPDEGAATSTDSPPSHRLDLTIAKAFDGGNGELMFGVSDLFNRNVEGVLAIDESGGHDTPGRTYFIHLPWKL